MSDLLKVKVGGSSYLCKWEPSLPKGLVYLTYFENVSSTDSTLTPLSVVGPAGTYRNLNYQTGVITSNIPEGDYEGVPSLTYNYLNREFRSMYADNYNPCILLDSLFKGNGSISIETILYIGSFINQFNPWQGVSIRFASGRYFNLGINTYSYERGILIAFPALNTPIASSGFHYYYPDGNATVSFSSDEYDERVKTGLHHLSIVIDRDKNQLRGYIDGVLAGNMNATISEQINFISLYNSFNKSNLITQFAIFNIDRSTNDGNTYPVPVKPYIKF